MSKKYLIGILVLTVLIAAAAYGYLHFSVITKDKVTMAVAPTTAEKANNCSTPVTPDLTQKITPETTKDSSIVRVLPQNGLSNTSPWYYKDDCHVYTVNTTNDFSLISGANPSTFVIIYNDLLAPTEACDGPECIIKVSVSKDRNAVFILTHGDVQALPKADPKTFAILKDSKGEYTMYGKDKDNVFNLSTGSILTAASASFVATTQVKAQDANHAYIDGKIQ
jgi:hypothetical protein